MCAKKRAAKHPFVDKAVEDALAQQLADVGQVARCVCTLWPLWPPLEAAGPLRKGVQAVRLRMALGDLAAKRPSRVARAQSQGRKTLQVFFVKVKR